MSRTKFLFAALSSAIVLETLFVSGRIPNVYVVSKVVVVLVAGAVMLPLLAYCASDPAFRPNSAKLITLVFSFQGLALALATVFSLSVAVSFWGGDWRRMGFLTSVAMLVSAASIPFAVQGDQKRWLNLLRVIVATGFVAGVYGVAQWFGFDPVLPETVRERLRAEFGGVYRPPGPIGQPAYYAAYLQYPAFAALALSRFDSAKRWRQFSVLAIVTMVAAVGVTLTRSGILGLIVGSLTFVGIVISDRFRRLVDRTSVASRSRRWAAILVSVLVIVIASWGVGTSWMPELRDGYEAAYQRVFSDPTSSAGLRLMLWRDVAAQVLPEVWLQGTGLGMFRPVFTQNRSDVYGSANPEVHFETAHNVFLDRWSEQGLFGLLVFLGLGVVFTLNVVRVQRSTDDARERWAIQAVGCGLLAALVANTFNGEVIPTTFYFYLWLGLSFAPVIASVPGSGLRADRRAEWIWFGVLFWFCRSAPAPFWLCTRTRTGRPTPCLDRR